MVRCRNCWFFLMGCIYSLFLNFVFRVALKEVYFRSITYLLKWVKLTEFIIILNTQPVVFYPGEQISGQVFVNFLGRMDMRGIELEFEGKHLLELAFYDNLRKNRHKSQDYVPEVYKENICKR